VVYQTVSCVYKVRVHEKKTTDIHFQLIHLLTINATATTRPLRAGEDEVLHNPPTTD